MFQHAYDHADSSESSGIGPATAQALLTNAEGQDGTDETDANEIKEDYRHTNSSRTKRRSEGSSMEKEPAGVSLDTDTASNSQELEDSYMTDEDYNEDFDEHLDTFLRDMRKVASLHART